MGAGALLVLLVIGSSLITSLAFADANDLCPGAYEASQVDLIEHRTFPPKSVCKAYFETGQGGAAIAPPAVTVSDSAAPLVFTIIAITGTALYGWWFARGVRRYPW